MPATPLFPAPSAHVCPSCAAEVTAGRCADCGLKLEGRPAETLWWLDSELHRLSDQRHSLLVSASPAARRSAPGDRGFPEPSAGLCPACDGPIDGPICGCCGIDLAGRSGEALWGLDEQLHRLSVQRGAVIAALREASEGEHLPPAGAARSPGGGARRIQYLLLWLGALCLVVAVVAFGAVAWTHMSAPGRGAVLAGATIAAAGAALMSHRRDLTATAEALACVAAAGALVDIQAVRIGLFADTAAWQVWAVGTAVVALIAWLFDRSVPLVTARTTALLVGQVPGVLVALGSSSDHSSTMAAVLVLQSAIVLGSVRVWGRRIEPKVLRAVTAAGAAVTWTGGLCVALLTIAFEDIGWASSAEAWAALAVYLGAGLVAVEVAVAWNRNDAVRVVGSVVAGAIAIRGAMLGFSYLGQLGPEWLAVALAGAATVVLAAVLPVRWRAAPAAVGATAAAWATLGGLPGIVGSIDAAGRSAAGDPWRVGLGALTRSLVVESQSLDLQSTALVLLAPVTIAAVAWWRNLARPIAAATMAASLVAATMVVPLAVGAPVWVAVAAPLVAALAALVLAVEMPSSRFVTIPAGFAGLAIAGAWASVSSVATIGALGLVLVVAALSAGSAVRRNDRAAAFCATGLALASATGLAAAGAAEQGATVYQGWLVASLAMVAASFAGWWMTRSETDARGDLLRHMGWLVEGWAGVLHVAALAVVAGSDERVTGWLLLSGALAMAAHATRSDRRILVVGAVAEALGFLWLQLAVSDVRVVEAYTLPLALVLLGLGGWALYGQSGRSSWDTIGPGIALALAPTVLLSIAGTGGVRPLAGALGAAVVLLIGVRGRLQAAVTLGAVALGAVAGRQLLPAASGLPPFLVFGVIGAVLLAVGATFEQRRRDLVDLRDRFESLR